MQQLHICALLLALLLTAGCTTPTQVISTDLTRQSGVYVIGYVDREDIRVRLEDRFVADLGAQGVRALPSHPDIKQIKKSSTADMVRAANSHDVVAIVIVNRVGADGGDSIIDSERKISPDNPDLHAYFAATTQEMDDYSNVEPIYAEVNAFFVDGNKTRRFWTGTSWAFQGEDDAVIGSISQTIAAELAKVGRELRDYSRPIQ